MHPINLRSRRGADGPLGFLIALPAWWATMGLLFVVGFWLWALAANALGMTRGGEAHAVGHDADVARQTLLSRALGGYAKPFASMQTERVGRAWVGSTNARIDVSAFPAPGEISVRTRFVVRDERFYPRPPDGGWE
jgi:hypothetical protein